MTTPRTRNPQTRRDLLTQFPVTDHADLIVRWPGDDGRLAYSFAEAAHRLARTFTGSAPDDALLMPFLYLYRHAIELELKQSIRYAARLRRNLAPGDGDLDPSAVNEKLKAKLGHRLMALADELDQHLLVLDVPVAPASVRVTLELLSSADRVGEAFRYSGSLPQSLDDVDFPALSTALAEAYGVLAAAPTMLENVEDAQEEGLSIQAELSAEFEEEMRAEFDDY